MTAKEFFNTREGRFRILVEQTIDAKPVDWYLVERRAISDSDESAAHKKAVEQFVGREVEFVTQPEDGGYVFAVVKETKEMGGK